MIAVVFIIDYNYEDMPNFTSCIYLLSSYITDSVYTEIYGVGLSLLLFTFESKAESKIVIATEI